MWRLRYNDASFKFLLGKWPRQRKALNLCWFFALKTRLHNTKKPEDFEQTTERCLVAQKNLKKRAVRV